MTSPADERFHLSELPTQKLSAFPTHLSTPAPAMPTEASSPVIFAAERFAHQTQRRTNDRPNQHSDGSSDSLALPILPALPSGSSATLRRWYLNTEDDIIRASRYDQSIIDIEQQLREQESAISEQGPPTTR